MTTALAHIIDEVERLSVPERIELRRHLATRIPMTGDLTEDDFATIAAETFSLLDPEVSAVGQSVPPAVELTGFKVYHF